MREVAAELAGAPPTPLAREQQRRVDRARGEHDAVGLDVQPPAVARARLDAEGARRRAITIRCARARR